MRTRRYPFAAALLALTLFFTGGVAQAIPGWGSAGDMAGKRMSYQATTLGNGKVLVTGGWGGIGSTGFLRTAELYDPAANAWSSAASMADQHGHHAAAVLPDGKVLVVGGLGAFGGYTLTAELYDPGSNSWSSANSMAVGRLWHSATTLSSGKVLVAGGEWDNSPNAELYDPATNSWAPADAMATDRTQHTATALPNGKILVAGGAGKSGALTSAELYDPATDQWSTAASMDNARGGHTATPLPNGKVLVTGGDSGNGSIPTAELYDPATDHWSPAASLATPRTFHTATLQPDGTVLVAGGRQTPVAGARGASSTELYDPAADRWSPAPNMSTGRYFHTATPLANGRTLVAGGAGESESLASAEVYPVEVEAPPSPPPPASLTQTNPPPAAPVTPDVLAPNAAFLGSGTAKLSSKLAVTVECGIAEDCIASAKGTLSVPGAARVYRLRSVPPRPIARGRTAKLRLGVPTKARRGAAKALRRRQKVRAVVTVRVADASGNATTLKRSIPIKR
jgi:hypothetical protein